MKKYNLPNLNEIIEKQTTPKEIIINPKTDLQKFKELYESLGIEYNIILNNNDIIIAASSMYFDENENFVYQKFYE